MEYEISLCGAGPSQKKKIKQVQRWRKGAGESRRAEDKLQTSAAGFLGSPWQSGTGAFHWWMPCGVRVQVAVVWPIRLKPRSQLKRKVLPSFVPV